MDDAQLRLTLEITGQAHLVQDWDRLDSAQQAGLRAQLLQLSPELLAQQRAIHHSVKSHLQPWTDVHVPTQHSLGHQALKEGRVACLVLAGGQASRMGCSSAKGFIEVSPVRNKSLFQLLAEATGAASAAAGQPLPLAIMVSPTHRCEVADYFEQHQRFGLRTDQLSLFSQEELPLLTLEKNWFLESPGKLAMGPDGNGGALHMLVQSGIWSLWQSAGVEVVRILLIDNPLADPFDAGLIGCHMANGWQVSLEAVERQESQERVGLLMNSEGRPYVAEYSEASNELKEARDSAGHLAVRWANVSQFCMSMEFIGQIAVGQPLPLHMALKRTKSLDGWSDQPNCYKCERFIFDALEQARSVGVVAASRSRFAPLKSSECLGQVRQALSRRDQRRLEQLTGLEQPEGVYELGAQFHYPTSLLMRRWSGKRATPGYVDHERA